VPDGIAEQVFQHALDEANIHVRLNILRRQFYME
jgi:hypothetical protein